MANDIATLPLPRGAKVKSKCQWRRWLYSMVINFGLFNMVICYSVIIHVHFCLSCVVLCCVRFVKCPIENSTSKHIHKLYPFQFLTHAFVNFDMCFFVYIHQHSIHTYGSECRLWFHLHNDIAIHTSIEWKKNKITILIRTNSAQPSFYWFI